MAIIFGLVLIILASPAFAQTPSPLEEFQAAVAAYQKTPGRDTALMVIQLYSQLAPPPAVPEEARRPFVMATTVFTESRDSAGIAKAIEFLSKAIFIAPYWSEARYNRAIAYEAAGQLAMAIDELKLYLGFNLAEAERREAQDRIYALEAKAEIAVAREAEQRRAEDDRAAEERRVANAAEAARAAEQRRIANAAEEARRATQARRAVITQIKNAINNRNYKTSDISNNSRDRSVGVNWRELFGGGTYYLFSEDNTCFWRYYDERIELIWVDPNTGRDYIDVRGESLGPSISDMRWYIMGCQEAVWGLFDLRDGRLYTGDCSGGRPISDSEFNPNKRYNYILRAPRP